MYLRFFISQSLSPSILYCVLCGIKLSPLLIISPIYSFIFFFYYERSYISVFSSQSLSSCIYLSAYVSFPVTLFLFLSIPPIISVYLSTHLSIYPSTRIYLSIYIHTYLSLSFFLSSCPFHS